MSSIVKVKTGSVYEDLNSYSRVVAVGDMIFVSNTAGRNYTTKEMPDDAGEQTQQVFRNIAGALATVDSSLADVVRAIVTIPDEADVDAVMAVYGEAFRGIDPAFTVTLSPLAGAYKVEIEVTAMRGAGDSDQERISVTLA